MHFTSQDIENRRKRLSDKWNGLLSNTDAVVIHCGSPIQKPGGLDQNYPFIPHPAYYWLTGRRREHEVVVYNKNTGWTEFQSPFTRDMAVWEREKEDILVDGPGKDISEYETWLNSQKFSQVYHLGQTDQPAPGTPAFDLRTTMDQVRRVKDSSEIALIGKAAVIAKHGYALLSEIIRPGISEKEIQIQWESEINRRGSHGNPYDTIVGSGSNGAILHALPTAKIVAKDELVLIDAGVSLFDYCVDITRTFPSTAEMDNRKKDLHNLVLNVQKTCVEMTVKGVYWRDVHGTAAKMFTEGLLNFGILKGSLSDLIEREIISLFFPHGLGHLVGLHVRDVGQEENTHPKRYFGAALRVDIQLEPGHLITVEPGLYFIKGLLNDADNMNRFGDLINRSELEHWMDIGGVRIEDNILVTENGNTNLTADIPKATF